MNYHRIPPSPPQDEISETQHVLHAFIPRNHPDPERHRGAPGQAVVLFEVDGLAGDLVHAEGPEDTGDAEEDFALCNPHSGAYAATRRGCELRGSMQEKGETYPAPNIQWSRS